MDEIQRRRKEGAEVVCIINSRDRQGKSEVIMLDHVSPAFFAPGGPECAATHLPGSSRPAAATPIVEWDAASGYLHHQTVPDVAKGP